MPSGRTHAVLFDWDGTLVDSAGATFRCYQRLFGSYGISFDRKRFEETYAPDWYQTYRLLGLPEQVWAEADARWLALYAREGTPPVAGARLALERIAAAGLTQGLVTSGDRRRIEAELKALGFDRYLKPLVCAGESPRPKPAPDPLLAALERIDVSPSEAVFVGDSPEDVRMARAAGVCVIGIPGGFPNRQGLQEAQPDHLADSLAAAVDQIFARAGLTATSAPPAPADAGCSDLPGASCPKP
jgi:HAD superfamily hydrolase (TIGR01509 family)